MPDTPNPKLRDVPEPPKETFAEAALPYAELDVTTNFSFLRGASHADELVLRATELGLHAIAVTDVNTLAGVVRMYDAARQIRKAGGWAPKLVIGARLSFADAPDVLAWATDRAAYGRLCRLLTVGRRRAPKGECHLELADFLEPRHGDGLLAAAVPGATFVGVSNALPKLREALGDRLSVVASQVFGPDDRSRMGHLLRLSRQSGVPLLATNAVHYHDRARRPLQDVLTCVRHGCAITEAGFRLFPNGERHLKSPHPMHAMFADLPGAVRRGLDVADQCTFDLGDLKYEYPDEVVPAGRTTDEHLRDLTYAGAADRYPRGLPEKVRALVEKELAFIARLGWGAYFLTVHDLVRFARSRDILCQGRGSAANSAVCYCLGVTSVDPDRIDVLFERFISAARGEPPDIDVDFEHERREEVIQYVYEKYGRDRAGMTATVISYRGRSAVRDVGKALGLGTDVVEQLASKLDWWHRGTLTDGQLAEAGIDACDATVRRLVALTAQLLGFPRHLSQHTGGLVMTRGPLCEMVPIENAAMDDRTVIEWDKDDIDTVGILKVDCLALGMLTCISKGLKLVNERIGTTEDTENTEKEEENDSPQMGHGCTQTTQGSRLTSASLCAPSVADSLSSSVPSVPSVVQLPRRPVELHTIPAEDPAVYDMICDADTIGVFQVESRAQMSMLPRLRPRKFYDLVIEVAIVRPGPIQGNMVHPYLRRRRGEEPVTFPSAALEGVLAHTLGVPLFQEQAMRVVMVAAGFSAEEADLLRRAMAAWRKNGSITRFGERIVAGMLANGYTREFAEQTFQQIQGFGEYGFPESHAASFAILVYASCWLKRHHPAAFACALLNSQPMGFYAPAQLVRDAREHGVEVRRIDVNCSTWDCTLEEGRHEGREVDGERHEGTKASGSGDCPRAARRHEGGDGGKATWGLSGPALRLGFRQIKGMREDHAAMLVAARDRPSGPFTSIEQFHRTTSLPVHATRRLAEADAFGSLGLSRRQAVWETLPLRDEALPLFDTPPSCLRASVPSCLPPPPVPSCLPAPSPCLPTSLPPMPLGQEVMTDYATTSLSLKRHPVSFAREVLRGRNVITTAELQDADRVPHGRWVKVAGLVLVRQRPGTASGVVFETIEDETGVANLILWSDVYERYRPAARHAGLLQADGYVQREGQVVHVLAKRLFDLSHLLAGYRMESRDFH